MHKGTMRSLILAGLAVATISTSAMAADIARPVYKAPPAGVLPVTYDWTGFYIGGHLGGAFSGNNNFNGFALSDNDARFMGGVQAGADWQFSGNWVVGAEGQYSWLSRNNNSVVFPGGLVYGNDQRALGSVTARLGYAFGPALVYVKGGYAYADNRETVTFAGVPIGFTLDTNHNHGWTIGGGAEYMFAPDDNAAADKDK